MSQRTNSHRPPTPNLPYSSNKQEFPTLSNSLVVKNKSPTPSQTPSPTKQNGVNSCKTSPSDKIPPRYKNFNYGGEKNRQQNEKTKSPSFKSNQFNRLLTRSGSNSPPPLEPKLEPIKETQLLKPKAEKGIQIKPRSRPEPVLSKEKLEAKTPTEHQLLQFKTNLYLHLKMLLRLNLYLPQHHHLNLQKHQHKL